MKSIVPQAIKNTYHLFQAILANVWYGFPSRKLKVIGVTGTDGKTTTTQMITRILEEAGKKVALASTINFQIGAKKWTNLSHFTTLSAWQVQKFIRQAVASGCEYAVLETSSHALDQYRVWGVDYEIAAITNVTREHLDYHQTMEKYREAKKKLFQKAKTVVINLEMENPDDFLQAAGKAKKITYSLTNQLANIAAKNIKLGINNSVFEVGGQIFKLKLVGDFNVENALAAIGVGTAEKIDLHVCAQALEKIENIPGRMEYVSNEKNLNILVDFALTPHALEKLYSLLEKIKKPQAKIIGVFGSCGERDRGKRSIMGEIVSRHANTVILTNDEPYREDPLQIIEEIKTGIKNKKEGIDFWIIPDRRAAIRKALQISEAEDVIAVTGMGAEESMVVGTEKIPWNDKKVILEELEKIKIVPRV